MHHGQKENYKVMNHIGGRMESCVIIVVEGCGFGSRNSKCANRVWDRIGGGGERESKSTKYEFGFGGSYL